jgi:hypothetical protein
MRSVLLLLLGVPIPFIILLGLCTHHWQDHVRRSQSARRTPSGDTLRDVLTYALRIRALQYDGLRPLQFILAKAAV